MCPVFITFGDCRSLLNAIRLRLGGNTALLPPIRPSAPVKASDRRKANTRQGILSGERAPDWFSTLTDSFAYSSRRIAVTACRIREFCSANVQVRMSPSLVARLRTAGR